MNKKIWTRIVGFLVTIGMVLSLVGCSFELTDEEAKDIEAFANTLESIAKEDPALETSESSESKETESVESTTEETTEATESTETTVEETVAETTESTEVTETTVALLDKDGTYSSKDDVALYIYQYGELPSNFITKTEAKKLGWTGGSVENYAPGMAIGGDYFGNYEGLLPEKDGRVYTECDIDTIGKSSRGSKRIIFSNDGLIYYTSDHYESFTLLYGEE